MSRRLSLINVYKACPIFPEELLIPGVLEVECKARGFLSQFSRLPSAFTPGRRTLLGTTYCLTYESHFLSELSRLLRLGDTDTRLFSANAKITYISLARVHHPSTIPILLAYLQKVACRYWNSYSRS